MKKIKYIEYIYLDIWKRVSKGITNTFERGDAIGVMEKVQYDITFLKQLVQIERKRNFLIFLDLESSIIDFIFILIGFLGFIII
jgi:hypothetical protein